MTENKKRSLLLAGGGLKVAYQAGCLQVLLDEAKIRFDHVDAASSGCLNAAMVLSGLSGTRIADNWRRTNPFDLLTFNVREYKKLFRARSIGLLEPLKETVLPKWGLDWDRIRRPRSLVGTFNVYNFTDKRLEVLDNSRMDADFLLACIALPMWLPPIERDGKTYFDAVYATDCNVSEAVRRGADELWCIWTVAQAPEYRDGFLAQYFHLVETVANTKFLEEWQEVRAVNELIDKAGGPDSSRTTPDLQLRRGFSSKDPSLLPPPGRKRVEQHLIRREVPVHYLLNSSQDRLAEAVELGVRDARDYCTDRGLLPKKPARAPARPVTEPATRLVFDEVVRGAYLPERSDPFALGKHELKEGKLAALHLTIHIEDLDAFLRDPEHEARITGTFECEPVVEPMPIEEGVFQLFTIAGRGNVDAPAKRRMRYSVRAKAPSGEVYRLEGVKLVTSDLGFDSLADLTTLFSHLYRVETNGRESFLGAGVLRAHALDFAKQLASFRVPGAGSARDTLDALGRFGRFFAGRAWDVHAKNVLDYAPI